MIAAPDRGISAGQAAVPLSGLVFTFVWNLDQAEDHAYVEQLLEPVRTASGRIDFVELYADRPTRLAREGTPQRLTHKASKRDVARSREILRRMDEQGRLNTVDGQFRYSSLLRYDTTTRSPGAVAIARDLCLVGRRR